MEFILFLTKKKRREFLKEPFLKIINESLRDPFESVRKKTCDMILELIKLLGEAWVVEKILPEVER